MTRVQLTTVLLGFTLACCGMNTASSEQLRIALIVSNGQYGNMPTLARCSPSATIVRDALRGIGFDVIERSDLGRGEFDTAIGALARRVAASSSALAVLYYCGYAVEFNGRSFLLPTSANITRDYDVLTQGIISKSLVDSLVRANQGAGFVLLDMFRTPDALATTGLGGPIEQMEASNFAVIGAGNSGAAEGPTAASLALRDQVAEREVSLACHTFESDALAAPVQSGRKGGFSLFKIGDAQNRLVGTMCVHRIHRPLKFLFVPDKTGSLQIKPAKLHHSPAVTCSEVEYGIP